MEVLGFNFPIYKQEGWKAENGPDKYIIYFLVFSVVVFFFEHYLSQRQYSRYQSSKSLPPKLAKFKAITAEKFEQSVKYGIDKLGFGMLESLFMFFYGIILLLLGYMPYLWDFSSSVGMKVGLVKSLDSEQSPLTREIYISIIFFMLTTLIDLFVNLPFSLYSTFVIEQKHGFNKSTLGLFFKDKVIMLGLTAILGSPILAGLIYLIRAMGPHFYLYVWIFLSCVSLIMLTVYPVWIAPLFNKYSPLEDKELESQISDMAKEISFPLTKIFQVDGSKRSGHSNAYFYGFFKNKRIVLYDTLIKQLTHDEVLGVLGHEMGHWKYGHSIQGFLISLTYTFCLFYCFSLFLHSKELFLGFGFQFNESQEGGGVSALIGLILFSQTVWVPVDKLLSFLMNILSRFNEFAADRFGVERRKGTALATGLIKISLENLGNLNPDPLYSSYHFSHPPLIERLNGIEKEMLKQFNQEMNIDWEKFFHEQQQVKELEENQKGKETKEDLSSSSTSSSSSSSLGSTDGLTKEDKKSK